MDIERLGETVREARNEEGWSQTELAKKADVGLQTVVRIEAGNGGVSADNLRKVLDALRLLVPLPIIQAYKEKPALHPVHIDSDQVDEVVHSAVSAACNELDALFPGAKPEVDGVSTDFAGLLEAHIRAMLCGELASMRFRSRPRKLVWQDADFGHPFTLPRGAQGYLVVLPSSGEVLEPSNSYQGMLLSAFRPPVRCTDLFSSWESAARGIAQYLTDCGNLEEVPVIKAGVFLEEEGVAIFEEEAGHST